MSSATERVPAPQVSLSIRVDQFDLRMIEVHRAAMDSRKRPLVGRHRIAHMFRESPTYVIGRSQRAAIDSLIDAGCDDDKLRAIGHVYDDYIEARIAERNGRDNLCSRQAFRRAVKEAGEATVAQLVCEQEPTVANRLRAEKEVREAKHAYGHYLSTLWHDALEHASSAVRRAVAGIGDRRWV